MRLYIYACVYVFNIKVLYMHFTVEQGKKEKLMPHKTYHRFEILPILTARAHVGKDRCT